MIDKKRLTLVASAVVLIIAATAAYVAWSVASGNRDLAARTEAAQDRVNSFNAPESSADQNTADQNTADQGPADQDTADPSPDDLSFADTVIVPGDVVFINRVPGEDYGRLVIVGEDGARTLLDKTCDRFHISGTTGMCIDGPQLGGTFSMEILDFTDATLPSVKSDLSLLPSRARVAHDEHWASSTVFVDGSSYQDVGGFTSLAWVLDLNGDGPARSVNAMFIEDSEPRHRAPGANFWGVSFGEDGNFWVSAAFGGKPELMHGNAIDQTLRPAGIEGSCPSLSPDGATLVYKRELDNGEYQLVARDTASGEAWDLGETRPVDDQVEWLDNDTILYGMHTDGSTGADVEPEFDIWKVDIAPGSVPELFAPQGDSPGVVR